VLDLTPSALGPQVKAAYFALAKLHHPDTAQVGTSPEVARLKADLFGAINEAYRILADDKSRAAYLAELKAGGSQEPVDAAAIFAAEEAFQKGCILVRARKYAEALVALDEAVRLNDKEGEFFAWRGWAAYLAAADKAAARRTALKEIELALKLNPKCAQAYYFGGQVLKLSGDSAGALKWFKKTLQLDERHVDAMREVRAAGSR
jgi:tetratricopeptide (TPR) repeat protein